MVTSTIWVWAATSGHLPLTPTRIRTTCTSAPLTSALRMATISHAAYLSAVSPRPFGTSIRSPNSSFPYTFSSRALRNLPLSVIMSGDFVWYSSYQGSRGTGGRFWTSRPYSYTDSRRLYFHSTTVSPMNNYSKPFGYPLRCVARFTCVFLPELSAASLFRL